RRAAQRAATNGVRHRERRGRRAVCRRHSGRGFQVRSDHGAGYQIARLVGARTDAARCAERADRACGRYYPRMKKNIGARALHAFVGLLALLSWFPSATAQLKIYGNTTTIELAPVLLAAQDLYGDTTAVRNGGIPDLFDEDAADVATNAETQALRQSVDHPDLRTILTVSEGWYRIVARRSSGVAQLADLRGKRITTVPNTSSAYYLHKMLGTVGMTTADVTVVPITPLSNMPQALAKREVDAVTIWEPEIENAAAAIGGDRS